MLARIEGRVAARAPSAMAMACRVWAFSPSFFVSRNGPRAPSALTTREPGDDCSRRRSSYTRNRKGSTPMRLPGSPTLAQARCITSRRETSASPYERRSRPWVASALPCLEIGKHEAGLVIEGEEGDHRPFHEVKSEASEVEEGRPRIEGDGFQA